MWQTFVNTVENQDATYGRWIELNVPNPKGQVSCNTDPWSQLLRIHRSNIGIATIDGRTSGCVLPQFSWHYGLALHSVWLSCYLRVVAQKGLVCGCRKASWCGLEFKCILRNSGAENVLFFGKSKPNCHSKV